MVRLASDRQRCPFRACVLVLILLLQSIAPAFAATAGNGNPTTYRGRTNTYDLPGRMATMRDGNNWSVGYTYGADGLIASRAKTIYVWMFGAWTPVTSTPTYFIHDGGEPVFELAQDMSEDPASTYSVSNITVRGPDGLVARKQGSSWIYYEFDQQGNVSQRRNSSGGLLTSSIYDAYGAETNNGGTPTDPFGYNAQWGYWLDRDTGLYLCQHRWYDPVTARWVNRDPIGYSGGANLYGYCGGGPVGCADSNGHEWWWLSSWRGQVSNALPAGTPYDVWYLADAHENLRNTQKKPSPSPLRPGIVAPGQQTDDCEDADYLIVVKRGTGDAWVYKLSGFLNASDAKVAPRKGGGFQVERAKGEVQQGDYFPPGGLTYDQLIDYVVPYYRDSRIRRRMKNPRRAGSPQTSVPPSIEWGGTPAGSSNGKGRVG